MTQPSDVLIVEDEPTIADIVCRYLARAGYSARIAGDGLEAVAAVAARRPDLIVLDIMLPGIDGLEVMRRVRAGTGRPIGGDPAHRQGRRARSHRRAAARGRRLRGQAVLAGRAGGPRRRRPAPDPAARGRALTAPEAVPGAFNVASGTPRTVLEMAHALAAACDAPAAAAPLVTGDWRAGDVRHVIASPALAAERLGYRAQEDFAAGMAEFAAAPLRR